MHQHCILYRNLRQHQSIDNWTQSNQLNMFLKKCASVLLNKIMCSTKPLVLPKSEFILVFEDATFKHQKNLFHQRLSYSKGSIAAYISKI